MRNHPTEAVAGYVYAARAGGFGLRASLSRPSKGPSQIRKRCANERMGRLSQAKGSLEVDDLYPGFIDIGDARDLPGRGRRWQVSQYQLLTGWRQGSLARYSSVRPRPARKAAGREPKAVGGASASLDRSVGAGRSGVVLSSAALTATGGTGSRNRQPKKIRCSKPLRCGGNPRDCLAPSDGQAR
jgi:hypothetical protein